MTVAVKRLSYLVPVHQLLHEMPATSTRA